MNVKTNNEKLAERKDHFAIRKLTVGAASVLIGTSLWLGSTNAVAKADTQENNDQNSDADVVSESNKAVNTQKVDKVVVETQQSTTNNVPSNNDAPTADTNADNQAQTQKAAEKPAETQKTESSETKSPVVNSNETTLSEKQDQDKVESSQVTSGELNTKQEEKPNNTSVVENNKVETASPTTEQNNKQLEDQNKTVTNQKQAQTPQVSDKNEEYSVNITNVDDSTGQTLYGTDSFKAKAGDKSHRIYTGYVGYKLMNPEALEGYEVQYPAFGHANLVVPDRDVNLTLHFAPLAPTTVEYVDTDGNLLTKFSDSSKASTSKSPYSDQDGIEDSKFMARAIDIPGYELVSDPVVEKPITQVSTKDDLNPMIIKFVYKKVAKNAEQGLPDGGGAGITGVGEDYGINWSKLPGGVSIDLVNKTYGDNSFEKTINNMDERYTKQGFSYIGVLNDHKDSDLTNRLESYVAVHFLPHKSVTVNYVDQDGKKLADSVELSFNKENPNQTNNGVNPKANWYPNGEWKSEQKSFDGYNLKTVRGATEGKFTTFNYTVTYVYTNQTSGNVVYIDDTDQKDLKDVALNGKIGSNIDYSTTDEIANYEKQGYELVSDDFSNGAKIFNADENKNKFTVHLKHKIETTTVSQDGNQVIHYVYADGSKAANDNEQTITFVKTTKTDAVNGKVIESSWAPESYTFENVVSPVIENYHPDKENVKGSTVTPDNSKVEVTVTYIENGTALRGQDTKPSTQTVKFVDEEGHELKQAVVSPRFNYEYSGDTYDKFTGKQLKEGSWNADSHTFDTVTVPVIDGYVAIDGFSKKNNQVVAGGLTSTRDNLNVVAEVVYQKVGKIIPVDPSGKPIPDVPTPTYSNDPTDPTKVTPDEPVPTIPKMTPQTPTVTPTDPGKDTPVIYNPIKDQVAVVNYVDSDENNKLITSSGDLTGDAGAKIDYSTESTIQDLTNKGYVLVNDGFPAGVVYDNDDNTTQTYTVVLKHGTTTITPDKPGKPGEPINPNDPDGPKFPQGTDENSVKRTGTQTIHYTGAGDQTPQDHVDNFNFTKTMVIDNVTGKVITDGSWNVTSHTFGNVDTPVIDGYHADKRTAGGTTITPEDLNKTVTVNYSQNGKIIPVDPSGKPIPNVPTPTYPTNPTDPTKVVPDEPVPTIPGMTPSTPTVTPTDPGKDTPVPYNPVVNDKGEVNVFVHDNTTGQNLTDYGYNSGSEDVGTKISYDKDKVITELTNKGYKVINPDVTIPGEIAKGTTNVTIYVEHDVVPVNPTNPGKPGEPINPNDPNGPKYPNGTDTTDLTRRVTRTINFINDDGTVLRASIDQTIIFTATGELDKVTGKWTKTLTWSPDQQVNGMDVPFIDGYHVVNISKDGDGVKSINSVTLSHTDQDYVVNVVYSKNGQINPVKDQVAIVNYIDSDENNKLIITSGDLTGKAGEKIDYSTASTIKDLENKGYVLVNDGFPVRAAYDHDDATTQTYTVILKHGIVPVTPDKPGNPGQPINPNDPNGPKWPEGTDSKSLTKIGTQTVHYQGADGQTPKDNVSTVEFKHEVLVDKVTGKIIKDNGWTSSQTYKSITTPTINGYTPDKNSVGGETVTLDQNGNGDIDKSYTVTYKKNAVPTPETVIGKQTITFVDGDNNTQLRNPEIQTHKFTNGESSYTFGTINVPVIDGYVAEVTIAGGKTVTPANPDASVVVVYHKIGKIVPVDPNHNPISDVPAPKYQNDPTDPTKVVPNQPTPDVPGYTPTEKTVIPQSPIEDTPVVYEKPKTIETIRPLPQNIPTKAKKSPATHTVTENKSKKDEHIQTVKPHAANVIGRTGIVRTNVQTPAKNTVVSNKQTVQSTASTKQALPQTGQANDSAAIVAGSLAAGLGLIGLAGVKKQKK
ncbi:mucin-binding protein [Lactobacillus intestinalis]|uniref:Mucus binding protein n=1 Tax=Lactobacillus intestinalis DSM 6629 TaxID=1423761 RepID=A0ABR5PQP5_9LACO|nr:MucBP domain-containing protein [Lactobacillus intestinalis]KRM33679.1 mucus binding protein [Lactobacillus intestinalis DSM 6629]UTW40763.1 MucBP domain-containing protein [Lactobacillus intestinalis]